MSKPAKSDRFESVVAEAPPMTEATPVAAAKKATLKVELGGDEIIQLSIKPSLWFVAIVSFKWVAAVGLLGGALAIALGGGWSRQAAIAYQVLLSIAAVGVGIGALQWASCTYVLTNRRVMAFKGIRVVDVTECPLARIADVQLFCTWYHRFLRLASIRMTPADKRGASVTWEHLARAPEIEETLERAVRKAQSSDSP